jgi:hypothetical protein
VVGGAENFLVGLIQAAERKLSLSLERHCTERLLLRILVDFCIISRRVQSLRMTITG